MKQKSLATHHGYAYLLQKSTLEFTQIKYDFFFAVNAITILTIPNTAKFHWYGAQCPL